MDNRFDSPNSRKVAAAAYDFYQREEIALQNSEAQKNETRKREAEDREDFDYLVDQAAPTIVMCSS